jgi:hypothetical protein
VCSSAGLHVGILRRDLFESRSRQPLLSVQKLLTGRVRALYCTGYRKTTDGNGLCQRERHLAAEQLPGSCLEAAARLRAAVIPVQA